MRARLAGFFLSLSDWHTGELRKPVVACAIPALHSIALCGSCCLLPEYLLKQVESQRLAAIVAPFPYQINLYVNVWSPFASQPLLDFSHAMFCSNPYEGHLEKKVSLLWQFRHIAPFRAIKREILTINHPKFTMRSTRFAKKPSVFAIKSGVFAIKRSDFATLPNKPFTAKRERASHAQAIYHTARQCRRAPT